MLAWAGHRGGDGSWGRRAGTGAGVRARSRVGSGVEPGGPGRGAVRTSFSRESGHLFTHFLVLPPIASPGDTFVEQAL